MITIFGPWQSNNNSRKKAHEAGEKLYVVHDQRSRTLGIRVPRTIFTSVLATHQETKTTRQAAVAAKDARLNHKAEEQVETSFPNIPRELISDILGHTLKKRSGRVGRTATIPFDESINLAVRAFIRHKMTDYDKLLRDGMKQKDARQKIRSKVEKVAEEWKGGTNESSKSSPRKARPQPGRKAKKTAKSVGTSIGIEIIDLASD